METAKNSAVTKEKNGGANFKKKIIKRIAPTLLISAVLPFIVCVCVPFEIFGNNSKEFLFSFSDFFAINFLFSLLFTAVIACAIIFLPDKAYRITCSVFIALGFLFFLQGTYLNGTLSSLSGDNLGDEKVGVAKKIFNLLLWLFVIGGAVTLSILKDKNGLIGTISLLVCGIVLLTQLMSPLMLCLTTKGIFSSREDRISLDNGISATKILTNENLTTISSNDNIFFFCIDRFDQTYAEKAYNECPEVFELLDGFTAFDDNISVYGHTFPGIANLLTAERFDANKSRETFLNEVYEQNDTLDKLHEQGYQINLYTQPYYAFTDASYLPEYVANVSDAKSYNVENKLLLSFSLMQIALYRCFPLIVKPLVGNLNSATCNSYVHCEGTNGYSQFSTDLKATYQTVTKNEFSVSEEKLFSFIHVEGCHGVDYDDNWNKAKLSQKNDILISLRNSFKIINEYITALKDANVYDNSTIIITGDHAYADSDGKPLTGSKLTALFFKPKGSSHTTLARSKAQVCHDDVWPTIFDSIGISPATSAPTLFDIDPTENRVRDYIWQTYFVPMNEHIYKINGAGKNFSNWKLEKTNVYDKYIMD